MLAGMKKRATESQREPWERAHGEIRNSGTTNLIARITNRLNGLRLAIVAVFPCLGLLATVCTLMSRSALKTTTCKRVLMLASNLVGEDRVPAVAVMAQAPSAGAKLARGPATVETRQGELDELAVDHAPIVHVAIAVAIHSGADHAASSVGINCCTGMPVSLDTRRRCRGGTPRAHQRDTVYCSTPKRSASSRCVRLCFVRYSRSPMPTDYAHGASRVKRPKAFCGGRYFRHA